MKKLIALALLLTGCASINYRIVGWYNIPQDTPADKVLLNNGQTIKIVGNPRIICYTKDGFRLADGYFVKITNNYLIVDEFGKDYVWLENNDLGNYCTLGGND